MRILLLLIALVGFSDAPGAEPLRVFLSPIGDDSADGLTVERPIKSLSRARDVVAQELASQDRDAEIRIAPGTYSSPPVKWAFFKPGHTITFLPALDDGNRPVFSGDGKDTWFTFSGRADGDRTGLVFRSIRVQNYGTAISFGGNRNQPKSSSRGNAIDGCYFTNIGEKSTAAVRFVNSAGNRVVNSYFVSIVSRANPGLLHAIYAAHGSSDNEIAGNRFEDCSGDPIRFRDGSDRNAVGGNRFIRAGIVAAVTDWFCDHEAEHDCTKPTPECPSWNNIVKGNTLDRTFAGRRLAAAEVYSRHIPAACSPPALNAERFIVSGNWSP